MSSRKVALIGFGRFGRAMAGLVGEAGVAVSVFDPSADVPEPLAASSLGEAVTGASMVCLAVPVAHVQAALVSLRPHLQPSQIVFDVGSVKVGPEADMTSVLGKEIAWVATHPLFGPASLARGERPLNVIVSPNPLHPKAVEAVESLYEELGCTVVRADASTHDQQMAQTHAMTFFIAKGLLDMGCETDTFPLPPSFQALARTLDTVRSDAGHLFFAIQNENPFAAAARWKLVDALSKLAETLDNTEVQPSEESASLSIANDPAPPELQETRALIDELDRKLLRLLGQRRTLSERASRAEHQATGQSITQDLDRKRVLLEERKKWAEEAGLSPATAKKLFETIFLDWRLAQKQEE